MIKNIRVMKDRNISEINDRCHKAWQGGIGNSLLWDSCTTLEAL